MHNQYANSKVPELDTVFLRPCQSLQAPKPNHFIVYIQNVCIQQLSAKLKQEIEANKHPTKPFYSLVFPHGYKSRFINIEEIYRSQSQLGIQSFCKQKAYIQQISEKLDQEVEAS